MKIMGHIKIDPRIRITIENGIKTHHRSLFVIVGDKGRDLVPILHHMLTKATVKARPNVLWCYKNDLAFANHRKSKIRKLQRRIRQGQFDVKDDDPFELFVASTSIRYCYHKDTHKVLGNTFGMCVLQDFETLTPNLLARTIETVEGGGIIVLLLQSVQSLKQFFVLPMDVHKKYRTEAHQDVIVRFNERFFLSLAVNPRCIVIDDKWNILPLSSHVRNVTEPPSKSKDDKNDIELNKIKAGLVGLTQATKSLVKLCRTCDQAQVLLQSIEVISDKKLDCTVSLEAARGRGKSATLGLTIAAAIGFEYSIICVTSPSPENLKTLFEFVFKGFDAMNYEEHTDYEIIRSTNPELNDAVIGINIKGPSHRRQIIQYLHPTDAHKVGPAELVVIDEAAAIPLPLVQSLLGPYIVFMSSTVNGYEGTGRSLSLKLINQLRKQAGTSNSVNENKLQSSNECRKLKELKLEESVRYKPGDSVELWLNKLLCLDVNNVSIFGNKLPSPDDCELYYVNRDTLFSYHKASETFLQRLMSLFVASHYKNSPNDLQMMADAPAHHIFCLLGPIKDNYLPEILCAIQVCLEGRISEGSIKSGLAKGQKASGDLIPWAMAQQFPYVSGFANLSGARIVRIATHPEYQGMGYGSIGIKLLEKYYQFQMLNSDETEYQNKNSITTMDDNGISLVKETLAPRKNLPPLLLRLGERKPEVLDYLGVSFGMTHELLKFWKRLEFTPTYLRQTTNDLTGEHSIIMLKHLNNDRPDQNNWLPSFWSGFRLRIIRLLGESHFRNFNVRLAFMIISSRNPSIESNNGELSSKELSHWIKHHMEDIVRLDNYVNNFSDYHLILDIVPDLANLYFRTQNTPKLVTLSNDQTLILIGFGLQYKLVEDLEKELDISGSHILGLFQKMMKKFCVALNKKQEERISKKSKLKAGQKRKKQDT